METGERRPCGTGWRPLACLSSSTKTSMKHWVATDEPATDKPAAVSLLLRPLSSPKDREGGLAVYGQVVPMFCCQSLVPVSMEHMAAAGEEEGEMAAGLCGGP